MDTLYCIERDKIRKSIHLDNNIMMNITSLNVEVI